VLTRLVPYLDSRRSGFLEEVYKPATFPLRDMLKALDLALAAYGEHDGHVPVASRAEELYERATLEHADDFGPLALPDPPGGRRRPSSRVDRDADTVRGRRQSPGGDQGHADKR